MARVLRLGRPFTPLMTAAMLWLPVAPTMGRCCDESRCVGSCCCCAEGVGDRACCCSGGDALADGALVDKARADVDGAASCGCAGCSAAETPALRNDRSDSGHPRPQALVDTDTTPPRPCARAASRGVSPSSQPKLNVLLCRWLE